VTKDNILQLDEIEVVAFGSVQSVLLGASEAGSDHINSAITTSGVCY
jgi:hypothetical protein